MPGIFTFYNLKQKLSYLGLIVFISVITLSLVIIQPLSAIGGVLDKDFYSSNNIMFYDPSYRSCDVSSGDLVGDDNPEKVWNFLISKSLTSEQAAGVMGNVQAESGFNPSAIESNSVGFGIVQWSYGRRAIVEKAAADAGKDVSDLSFQLEFLYTELNARPVDSSSYSGRGYASEWDGLTKQQTIEDALVFFHHEFEISHLMDEPDPRAAVIKSRGQFANNWFEKFNSNSNPCVGSGTAVHPIADGTLVNEGYGGPRKFGSVTCKGMIWHNGYDLHGTRYTTEVKAAMSGVVSGPSGKNNMISIRNDDGFVIQYLHMDSGYILVKEGDNVTAGQQIGFVGNTGFSSGAHLHFQVEVSGNTNPMVAELPIVNCGGQFVNPSAFMKLFGVDLCNKESGCDNPVTS